MNDDVRAVHDGALFFNRTAAQLSDVVVTLVWHVDKACRLLRSVLPISKTSPSEPSLEVFSEDGGESLKRLLLLFK